MCRKQYFRGFCMVFFGLGLLVGHCLDSWLVSCGGGLMLMAAGLCIAHKR